MAEATSNSVSVSAFVRDPADFADRLKKSGRPVVLTLNGEGRLVLQDVAAYRELLDRLAEAEKAEMKAFLTESLADLDAGRTVDAIEYFKSLGRRPT